MGHQDKTLVLLLLHGYRQEKKPILHCPTGKGSKEAVAPSVKDVADVQIDVFSVNGDAHEESDPDVGHLVYWQSSDMVSVLALIACLHHRHGQILNRYQHNEPHRVHLIKGTGIRGRYNHVTDVKNVFLIPDEFLLNGVAVDGLD